VRFDDVVWARLGMVGKDATFMVCG
jgi:hypothetical protein